MKTYNITFTYEKELDAGSKEQALEMAEDSLSNAIHSEGTNCFVSETVEMKYWKRIVTILKKIIKWRK